MSNVFLFPGQGSQTPGMGKEVAEAYPDIAGAVFRIADEILGFSLSRCCFEGPAEALAQTEITQPALFTTSVAILRVLEARGVAPAAAAGHSVGEYAALVAAGSFSFEDGLPVVRRRGELMAEAVAQTPGAMAAIIGLDRETIESICHEASSSGVVEPSNLNAPTQIVISGHTDAVLAAMEAAVERGGRSIRLNVSAPFHCSLMAPVTNALAQSLDSLAITAPTIPVYANATAEPVTSPAAVRQALLDQIESPVKWTDTMVHLLEVPSASFLEIGPGRVLAGLMRDRSIGSGDRRQHPRRHREAGRRVSRGPPAYRCRGPDRTYE